jgi:hypothetical protein
MIKALTNEQFETIVRFFSMKENISRVWTNKIDSDIASLVGISVAAARSISKAVTNLADLAVDETVEEEFLSAVTKEGFDDITRERIKKMMDLVKKAELRKEISKSNARVELANFGIPHLHGLSFQTDYRVLHHDDGEMELVPSVIWSFQVHENFDETRTPETKPFVFQTQPEVVDSIMKHLGELKKEMQAEMERLLIKDKAAKKVD